MMPAPDGALAGYCSTTVRRVDRRGVLIDIPRLDGEDLMLRSGQPVTLFVQIHGRMYEFATRVLEAELQVLLAEPDAAKKTERRSFFRLMMSVPVRLIADQDEGLPPDELDVLLLDLSGGGARIRSTADLPVGTRCELVLPLDDRELSIAAEVVRSTAIELGRGSARFEAHCQFTDIDRADQDQIVRFIFRKQRELSQRGVA